MAQAQMTRPMKLKRNDKTEPTALAAGPEALLTNMPGPRAATNAIHYQRERLIFIRALRSSVFTSCNKSRDKGTMQ